MRNQQRKTLLVLEDGTAAEGFSYGIPPKACGRITANDSITGFQEILTDPSNAGCVVMFTCPHVGNYGAAAAFSESSRCHASAVAVKRMSPFFSGWQAETSFGEFLASNGVPFIEGIDTRMIARKIHEKGEMKAALLAGRGKKIDWGRVASPRTEEVSAGKIKHLTGKSRRPKIGIIDLGVKNSLLSVIKRAGFGAVIIPFDAGHREIKRLGLSGLVFSSGPEDPAGLAVAGETAGNLMGSLPILGIGAGCIALGMALGAKVVKLPSGHRGMNYPVLPPGSFRGSITSQNHRLAPDAKSKLKKTSVTLLNPDDGTAEAIESRPLRLAGILFEPVSLNGAPRPELARFFQICLENPVP